MSTAAEQDAVDRLLELEERITHLKAELEKAKTEQRAAEDEIAELWIAQGKQRETRRGYTLYQARDFHCSVKKEARDALRRELEVQGLGDFITTTVATQSLKSWLKEEAPVDPETGERDWANVPAGIRDAISVFERFRIRVRRS